MSWEPNTEEIRLRKQREEIERISRQFYINNLRSNENVNYSSIGSKVGQSAFNMGEIGDLKHITDTITESLEGGVTFLANTIPLKGAYQIITQNLFGPIYRIAGGVDGQKFTLRTLLPVTIKNTNPATNASTVGNIIMDSDLVLGLLQSVSFRFQKDTLFTDGKGGWVIDSASGTSSVSDNLGNHTATNDLNMATYDILSPDKLFWQTNVVIQAVDSSPIDGVLDRLEYNAGNLGAHDFFVDKPNTTIPRFAITETSIESNVILDMNGNDITSSVNPATNQFKIVFDGHDDSDTYISNSTTTDRINVFSNGVNILSFRSTDVLMGINLNMNAFNISAGGAGVGMSNIGTLSFVNNTETPAGNGIIYFDGTDLKAKTGSTTINLTNIGGSWVADATSTLDMNTYDIEGIDRLIFSHATSSNDVLLATDYGIEIDGGTGDIGLRYNVPSTKEHNFYVASQLILEISVAGLKMGYTDLYNLGTSSNRINYVFTKYVYDVEQISFSNTIEGQFITSTSSGLQHNVPTGDTHQFIVANNAIIDISSAGLNMKDKELDFNAGGRIDFADTGTTIGANGSASALTANPVGYIKIRVGGTERQIPYYNT